MAHLSSLRLRTLTPRFSDTILLHRPDSGMPSPLNLCARVRRVFSRSHRALRPAALASPIQPPVRPVDRAFALVDLENILLDARNTNFVRTAGDGRYALLFTAEVDAMLVEIRFTKKVQPEHCRNPRFLALCVALVIANVGVEYWEAVDKVQSLVQTLAEAEMAGTARVPGWLETYGTLITLQDTVNDWRILDVAAEGRGPAAVSAGEEAEEEIDWIRAGQDSVGSDEEDEPIDWVKAGQAGNEPEEEVIDWVAAGRASAPQHDEDEAIDWIKAGQDSSPETEEPNDWVRAGQVASAERDEEGSIDWVKAGQASAADDEEEIDWTKA
jgi:hypothetical protein